MENNRKSLIGIIVSIAVLLIVSVVYFYPDIFEGNELRQHDTLQGKAISHEINSYLDETGEQSMWTNSLFGGMPAFQIAPSYTSGSLMNFAAGLYRLWLPSPAGLLFMMMLGFFILLLTMKVKWYLALPGAIAYGFSSYFIIIIGAGHIWKFITLAYIPPTIAGMVLCYRGRYLAGGALAAFFAMLQISGNHIQMSYYFLMVVIGLAVAFGIILFRQKKGKQWGIATATLAGAAILAVLANSPNLYNTYEYSKETMRGRHSELTQEGNSSGVTSDGGLNKEYITAWSYGKSETFTLLIPNVKGGATIKPEKGGNKLLSLGDTEASENLLNEGKIQPEIKSYLNQLPQYFGDQPMTNGPVYIGAIMIALFLLGCIIVKGPIKWMLLIVTILSIALSWGHNMMWLTDLMIDHFPMYNKFRTVASILVVAEFTIPLLAILALKQIVDDNGNRKQYIKPAVISFGICLAICLIGIIQPSIFGSYLSQQEHDAYVVTGVAQQVPQLFSAIENVRMSLVSTDSLRSFIFLALGLGIIILLMRGTLNRKSFCALLTILVIADLFSINKRYLDTDSFTAPESPANETFPMSNADRRILADTTMNYRVMDIPRFADAAPSYYHKTIGGYHAAKLTRYQDMIDRHLGNFSGGTPTQADMNILNMLNAKYIVMGADQVFVNPDVLGNAWLIDNIIYAPDADAEMAALDTINPAITAVSDNKFKETLGTSVPQKAPADTIFETTYAPNRLSYHGRSANGGIAVFSEIFFPWGWECTVNGESTPIGRVDYLLRAIRVPAGEWDIIMKFDPKSTHTATTIATIAVILIYLLVIMAIVVAVKPSKTKK